MNAFFLTRLKGLLAAEWLQIRICWQLIWRLLDNELLLIDILCVTGLAQCWLFEPDLLRVVKGLIWLALVQVFHGSVLHLLRLNLLLGDRNVGVLLIELIGCALVFLLKPEAVPLEQLLVLAARTSLLRPVGLAFELDVLGLDLKLISARVGRITRDETV